MLPVLNMSPGLDKPTNWKVWKSRCPRVSWTLVSSANFHGWKHRIWFGPWLYMTNWTIVFLGVWVLMASENFGIASRKFGACIPYIVTMRKSWHPAYLYTFMLMKVGIWNGNKYWYSISKASLEREPPWWQPKTTPNVKELTFLDLPMLQGFCWLPCCPSTTAKKQGWAQARKVAWCYHGWLPPVVHWWGACVFQRNMGYTLCNPFGIERWLAYVSKAGESVQVFQPPGPTLAFKLHLPLVWCWWSWAAVPWTWNKRMLVFNILGVSTVANA